MEDAYIVSIARTPIGKFGGALKVLSAVDLGAHAMRAAVERAGIQGGALDLYIMGNILRAGHGQLLPRQAAIKAGIPIDIDGYAVDMVCASGMMAVINASMAIRAGEVDLVLAGGMESMSQAGFYLSHRARWGYRLLMGNPEQVQDTLLVDGLTDPFDDGLMGHLTERVAAEHGISRKILDEFAHESHRRAAEAATNGLFEIEIAPIQVKSKTGTTMISSDEGVRHDTSPETLAKLSPAFGREGTLTVGNSSQISDGAAALVVASESAVKKYGLRPLARIVGSAWAATEGWRFVEAPLAAIQKLLRKLQKKTDDIDLFENNEAFAVNSALFTKVLGVDGQKLNVYGGAIALGHPIGCSGARILVTLINALHQRNGKTGIASLCHGTGGATAIAVERL
ncbi:MAG TPA: thiolase family protein [Candidatus Binatia bacterium]